MVRVRRRTVLRAGGLSALGAAAGCAGVARTVGLVDPVRIAVSWSATELGAFRAVLRGQGIDNYELVPLGDDIDAALGARTAGRPDVVALPRSGLVWENRKRLERVLGVEDHPAYTQPWRDSLPPGGYALPFKLAHKSVVWYRKTLFAEHGLRPPDTWEEWLALNESIIATRGAGAPLALGGADGWMLSGLFENVLLRNFVGLYDALSDPEHDPRLWNSAPMRAAFEMLGELCGRPGVFAGGLRGALVQQFPDAVLEVFGYRRAAMVVAPDFAESVIRHFGVSGAEAGTFTFPSRSGTGPLVFGGDLLVLTQPATEEARALVDRLGRPGAPVPWIRDIGGFIAGHPGTGEYSPTLGRLSDEVRGKDVRFDLTDELGVVGGGLDRVLVDFLRDLGDGVPRAEAARTACTAMVNVDESG